MIRKGETAMIEIDVRGFSCPIPVVRTDRAIEENSKEVIKVFVDSVVSRENVFRMAKSKGYSVEIEDVGDGFRLRLSPSLDSEKAGK